jgi:sugar phosphate isomerase/epimerase
MKSIKGPAIFLAQFADDAAPFNTFDSICGWAASLGYKGVQIPAWDSRFIDLKKAAASVGYCEELTGTAKKHGVEITELATHLQGQLVAVNPVYDQAFDAFAAKHVRGNPKARQEWATEQVTLAAKASRNMGLKTHVTFSGALAWPFLYPWPPLPAGLIEAAFDELARRWKPILDAHEDQGVDVAFELHPGEDLFDGVTFDRFLDKLKGHKRCGINYDPSHFRLQALDYVGFIDSGFSDWPHRAGRFRSLGDGDIDFGAIFSNLSVYGYDSWAVLEWECAIKNRVDGAREGAEFIKKHLIEVSQSTFEDFIDQGADHSAVKRALGIEV